MRKTSLELSGWGRYPRARCDAARPERFAEAVDGFTAEHGPRGLCVHGAGRSYGDCSLNEGGAVLMTGRLDRILAFDAETGIVQVEPGVDYRRLMEIFLPRGWLAPVTPGTGFATIGGAVANDVHGKNHELDGSFGQHVTELDVRLADGSGRTITPSDSDLFAATVGGVGLTGFITRIAFRMKRVPGGHVQVREQRVADLDAFLAAMQAAAGASYTVGWIDGSARGARLGRGILETAEPVAGAFAQPAERARRVPVDFPALVLNPLSVALFNEAYFRRVPADGRSAVKPWRTFLYPLDAIHDWNRIYGKPGFVQFQCVVPFENAAAVLKTMLEAIARSHQASFLAVLKRMGAGRAGFLSFPMPGYTMALDFPRRPGVEALYAALCAMTRDAGGRVYLAKDALLDAASFRRMYPEFARFAAVRAAVDPDRRMQSAMARRLRLQDAA
jgi:decaprenylphospho-beta-D-ribofuranose 2-oxidase